MWVCVVLYGTGVIGEVCRYLSGVVSVVWIRTDLLSGVELEVVLVSHERPPFMKGSGLS